jgi:putative ABC transport system permease protein
MDWSAHVRRHLRLQGLDAAREAELVEDVAHQLDDAYREALAAGLAETEARARAERHITDWAALARDLSSSPRLRQPAVDRWSNRLDDRAIARGRFGGIAGDVRHAIRLMLKTPGFSVLAILMLALGTGANAAVFSVVDAVMLRSPFERPHEIAGVTYTGANGRLTSAVPREAFDRLAGLTHVVSAASPWTGGSPVVTGVDEPRRVQMECVRASMAVVLGAHPLLGRWFSAEEDTPAGPPVGLVSYVFWQRTLNGDPSVIGRRVMLDGVPLTIVGVMRPGFDGAASLRLRDIWVPYGQVTATQPRYGCRPPETTVNAFVRVRSGLSIEDATAAANAALGPAVTADSKSRLGLFSVVDETFDGVRPMFTALVGAVIAVLLIAGANVANLSLARLVGRRREIAVRLALGATRARIVLQTVTEQLVVAAAGAAVGIGLGRLALDALIGLLPRGMPHAETVALNGRVLAASIGVALLSALVVGLIPAIQASSLQIRSGLADDCRTSTAGGRRVRWTLVVGELALGVMLLVGALLMIRTFFTLRMNAPGFDPTNKIVALVQLPAEQDVAAREQFAADISRELLNVPGVAAVARSSHLPPHGNVSFVPMLLEGQSGEVFTATISANYFEVIRVPVVRGRGFLGSDAPGSLPVVIANEAFVRKWLPGREPLDAVVTVDPRMKPTTARRIVGVVPDMRFFGSDTRPRPQLFFPIAQETPRAALFIVSATPAALAGVPAALRQVAARLRPDHLVDRIDRFESLLAAGVDSPRLGAWLFGIFGGLAVILAAIGLGGTLAWSVAERRREFGVRVALGATPGAIRGLVLRHTIVLTALAIVLGLTGAWFASRLIEGWMYGVGRTDAPTYATCGAVMLAVALVAAYLPTRRATRVDPLTSLRTDG